MKPTWLALPSAFFLRSIIWHCGLARGGLNKIYVTGSDGYENCVVSENLIILPPPFSLTCASPISFYRGNMVLAQFFCRTDAISRGRVVWKGRTHSVYHIKREKGTNERQRWKRQMPLWGGFHIWRLRNVWIFWPLSRPDLSPDLSAKCMSADLVHLVAYHLFLCEDVIFGSPLSPNGIWKESDWLTGSSGARSDVDGRTSGRLCRSCK